jgi:hypothetical protein
MAKLKSSDRSAVLLIHSYSAVGVPLHRIADFLGSLEEAYNALLLLDHLIEDYDSFLDEQHQRLRQTRLRDLRRFGKLLTTRESLRRAGNLFASKSRLRVSAIEVGSPDFWAFAGKIIPIDAIRQWVQDAHERRKDKTYREAAEARKLELDNEMKRAEIEDRQLENELKKVEIFDKKIGVAKQLGATDEDLAPLLQNLFYKPLKRLERFDDVIESVEVRTEEGDEIEK